PGSARARRARGAPLPRPAVAGGRRRGLAPAGQLPQHRVDAREAALRTFLDAVLHRRVALLGGREDHRLRQLRPLRAELLELERLDVVLEGLDEPGGRLDLAELALDDPVAG